VDYLKNNGYGNPVKAETLGESSILLKKKQNDGVTYNLIFFKNNVHAALSAKYKKDKPNNIDHIVGLAEKLKEKYRNMSELENRSFNVYARLCIPVLQSQQ